MKLKVMLVLFCVVQCQASHYVDTPDSHGTPPSDITDKTLLNNTTPHIPASNNTVDPKPTNDTITITESATPGSDTSADMMTANTSTAKTTSDNTTTDNTTADSTTTANTTADNTTTANTTTANTTTANTTTANTTTANTTTANTTTANTTTTSITTISPINDTQSGVNDTADNNANGTTAVTPHNTTDTETTSMIISTTLKHNATKTNSTTSTSTLSGSGEGTTVHSISADEPITHKKSDRSLALGITIPVLIVVIVLGGIWLHRRFKKVPKSGSGYLTLGEEAHTFGSLQNPTYDLDL